MMVAYPSDRFRAYEQPGNNPEDVQIQALMKTVLDPEPPL